MSISKNISLFLKDSDKDERYASFDYCYNYFYSFYKQNKIKELASVENMQLSCLHVGFYLASWGMMRGSSFLLEKSVRHYRKLIETIAKMDRKMWEIDVDNYNDEHIEILLDCKQKIIQALKTKIEPSDTLVTKIMLGVFANVPAFDRYFRKTFKVHSFNKKSLNKIKEFYLQNKSEFDDFRVVYTFDFESGNETKVRYTKAKLMDMYGFMKSQD